MNQIRKAIKNLISNPTISNQSSIKFHPFESTTDLYHDYQYLFNEDAKRIFLNRTQSMIHQYNQKTGPSTLYEVTLLLGKLGLKKAQENSFKGNYILKYSIVVCFGFICETSEIDEAVKHLIETINAMASNKLFNASLYNVGKMDSHHGNEHIIFSYLAIPAEHESYVRSNFDAQYPEGGTPRRFKNVVV